MKPIRQQYRPRRSPHAIPVKRLALAVAMTLAGASPSYAAITATASSDDGNVAANSLDGNLGTRWSALGDNQWISFNLDGTYSVSGVELAFFNGDQRVAYFDILVSNDNRSWTQVYKGQSSGTSTQFQRFSFTPVQARYLRILGHGNSANEWNSLTEVRITMAPVSAGNGVSVYQNFNYGGYSAQLGDGRYTMAQLAALGVQNDDLSSVRVPSGYTVELFENDNFSGTKTTLTADAPQLANNDTTSSIIVRSARATVYQNYDYGGYAVGLPLGSYTSSQLGTLGVRNNDLSSVRVPNGLTVELYDGDNFSGTKTTLTADSARVPNNDTATSLIVKQSGSGGGDTGGGTVSYPTYCNSLATAPSSGQWQSSRVFYQNGRLTYAVDGERNRIPDFSYVGYHYGEKPLPNVRVVTRLGPVSGDNTKRIQDALNAIGNRTPDANGYRGALLLEPGRYNVDGIIRINKSGVVLRGSGDGTDSSRDTILVARGNTPEKRTVIIMGSGDTSPWDTGSATNITNSFVQVGSRSFNVQDPSRFRVGMDVRVRHPSSARWIDAVDGGGVINDPEWTAGQRDLWYNRKVVRIEGSTLHLDAPIYNHLDRNLTQATVAPVTNKNMISESGIENLRVDIVTRGGEDENHAWSAIGVIGAENSWVRGVTALHFGKAGVFTSGARQITVTDARMLDPVAIRTGGNMYNFAAENNSDLILFSDCHATSGRHNFITNGSGSVHSVVFHNCTSGGIASSDEAHRQWNTGVLFDNIRTTASGTWMKLYNRGDAGSSHGWAAAHSAIWNFNDWMEIQKPPTAQNYAISQSGRLDLDFRNPGPRGFTEIKSGELFPKSLYRAQLCERLKR